ncbi:MAG TPA: branched-chain amino acid ABC transporter permease [Desulfobacteraceae bacterium]|nr:branched-chain amino acid ABC transporter permease [Desulfobacteraceae bacterium]
MTENLAFFSQLIVTGLVLGSVYALVALGFVLIYKSTSVLNFAQGELLMLGAYICLALTIQAHIPFVWSFLLTLAFSFAFGLLVERTILRPMIGESIISVIMITIALSTVMRSIIQIIWGTETKVFPQIFSDEPIYFLGLFVAEIHLFSLGFAVICVAMFGLFFKFSSAGLAMRVTAFDQQVAQTMGINIKRIFALAWAISAIVSSIGGIILGNINGISNELAAMGLKVFPCVILGGLDSIIGAIVGGFMIGILENIAGGYLDPILGGGVKELAPFVFLIIILMIKPYGLFGKKLIERL